MPRIAKRLAALGLVLPAAIKPPPGVVLPFQFVRVIGTRALISGHGPQNADGSIAEPLGKLGRNITVEQGYAAARLTGLSILGSLQRTLGDLDRITSWVRVFGMVNSGPGFNQQPIRAARSAWPNSRSTYPSRSKAKLKSWRSVKRVPKLPIHGPAAPGRGP